MQHTVLHHAEITLKLSEFSIGTIYNKVHCMYRNDLLMMNNYLLETYRGYFGHSVLPDI